MNNCTDCILDLTDACPRGAGRAVDDTICEEFIGEQEENEFHFNSYINGLKDGKDIGYVKGFENAIDKLVEMLTNDGGLDIILDQKNRKDLKTFIWSNGEQIKEEFYKEGETE